MSPRVPLTVLDLAVIPEGGSAASTLRGCLELAGAAERSGYRRYWLAEHHLTAGIAAASPLPVLGAIAQLTWTIRVGSGATLTGHRTALSIAEDFATLAALAPGRVDLGFGRSPARGREAAATALTATITRSPRFARRLELQQQEGAIAAAHAQLARDVKAFLDDEYTDPDGTLWSALPGGAQVELWSLGSSAGESAAIAAELDIPFAVNNHMNPAGARAAAAHYRRLQAEQHPDTSPVLAVSAEVCIAEDDATARATADAHLEWVRRQRVGGGITPFPARGSAESAADPLVADRASALVVGTPGAVREQLDALVSSFDAQELVISVVGADTGFRTDGYVALAEVWGLTGG